MKRLLTAAGRALGKLSSLVEGFGESRRMKKVEKDDVDEAMETVYRLLQDQEFQNSRVPEELRRRYSVNNIDQDRDETSYGISPLNPVRVNGVLGELAYISRLAYLDDGVDYVGHRLGSVGGLDVYELVSCDGLHWLILFFDMYWDKRDVIAPDNLWLSEESVGTLSAMNRFSSNFPCNVWQELLESTNKLIGFPAVKAHLRDIKFEDFERTEDHTRLLQAITVHIRAEGTHVDG